MSTPVSTDSDQQAADTSHPAPVVAVRTTIPAPLTHVWEVLVSPRGSAALLGEGAVLGAKGEPYHCADGTSGVVRSYHPLEQLRVSWHENPASPPTLVEVDLSADGDGTLVELSQSHLTENCDVEHLRGRWAAALEALTAAL